MSRKNAVASATAQSSTNDGGRPRRSARERLESSVLEELWSIWQADPRVPSAKSRRSWAISRNSNPRLVGGWFLRRRACAKKAGQPLADSSYDLSFDLQIAPKQEPIELELDAIPDLPSDDTLAYLPDVDHSNDLEASSDTAFDEDVFMDSKGPDTPAYTEVTRPEHFYPRPKLSLYAVENSCDEDTPLNDDIFFPVCNQGGGQQSDFTCILCTSELAQDMIQSDFNTMSDARATSSDPPLLEFSPTTLSELSAIPFLFRTPAAMPPDHTAYHQSLDDWTIVEDELARLVNDGKLDFSFLDVPHLAFIELID